MSPDALVNPNDENSAQRAGTLALEWVKPGMVIGLGTGRAASGFIRVLGHAVSQGLAVTGVATSLESERLARSLGIPLVAFEGIGTLDLAVDGADEITTDLNLIKGYGGAMVREKLVAGAANIFLVVAGGRKLVAQLGQRGQLPIEVIPFGREYCRRRLLDLGLNPHLRYRENSPAAAGENAGVTDVPYLSDNGNLIYDCRIEPIADPTALEHQLRAIPGVVGTGLFLGMAVTAFIQERDTVRTLSR